MLGRARPAHAVAAVLLALLGPAGALPVRAAAPGEPAALSGRVVDDRGRPVAGARVAVSLAPADDVQQKGEVLARATTAPRGRFRLPGLARGGSYEVSVARRGFAPERLDVTLPAAGAPPVLRIALRRGSVAVGRVEDEDGRPVAGATVEMFRVRPRLVAAGTDRPELAARSTTGEDGRFRLRDLPPGRFELAVRGPEILAAKVRGVQVRPRPPGSPGSLDSLGSLGSLDIGVLKVRRGELIEGLVSDPDGRPLAGVEVWMTRSRPPYDRADFREPAAVTGADGRFAVRQVARGETGLASLCLPGYMSGEVILAAPASAPVRAVLQPAGRLAGRLVDEEGEPVAGGSVSARYASGETGNGFVFVDPCPQVSLRASARSDAEGRFVLEQLVPGWYDVEATAPGFLPSGLRTLRAGSAVGSPVGSNAGPGQAAEADFVLSRGAVLAGRVVDAAGSPAAGVEVSVAGPAGIASAATGEDGEYRIGGLAPGASLVTAEDAHGTRASAEPEVEPGENRLDLTLEEPAPWVELTGRVVDAAGRPAAGARVEARMEAQLGDPGFAAAAAFADGDGSFALGVSPGRYSVWAAQEGLGVGATEIDTESGPTGGIEVRLEPWSALAGRISGLSARELSEVSVSVAREPAETAADSGQQEVTGAGADGGFLFPYLEPGPWKVTARLDGRRVAAVATLTPGVEAAVDLAFPAATPVRGQVVGERGEPAGGVLLTFWNRQSWAMVLAGGDGRFDVRLPDGTYQVELYGGNDVLERPVEVAVGRTPVEGLTVRIAPGAVLRGRMLGIEPPRRRPLSLLAQGPEGRRAFGGSDQEGNFQMTGLSPGEWTVTARYSSGAEQREARMQVVVPRGAKELVQDLDLALGDLDVVVRIASEPAKGPPSGAAADLSEEEVPPVLHLVTDDAAGGEVATAPFLSEPGNVHHFANLRPGRYRLVGGDRKDAPTFERHVEVEESGEVVIDLRP